MAGPSGALSVPPSAGQHDIQFKSWKYRTPQQEQSIARFVFEKHAAYEQHRQSSPGVSESPLTVSTFVYGFERSLQLVVDRSSQLDEKAYIYDPTIRPRQQRPRGEKWVPNPENLVKDGKMLKDVNGNVLLHKDLAGRDNVVVYLECTWKDKDKDRKRGSASGGESGVTDADDSGGTGGEDSEEARGRTAEKSDETPPLPPTSGKQPMWQETQDQKEDRCCKVGLFRVFLKKEWEDLKDADTRPCKKQKTAAVQKTAAAKRPCICITLPFKPPEAFEDFLKQLAFHLTADRRDWNQQQLGLLKSIFDRKMDEAIQEGTRVVSGEQFLREEPLDDISDQCPGTEACDVSDSAEAGVEAHDASSP